MNVVWEMLGHAATPPLALIERHVMVGVTAFLHVSTWD